MLPDAPEYALTDTQRLAVEALLAGSGVMEAARAAGVERHTVSRWNQSDAFQAALAEGRAEITSKLRRRILNRCEAAVEILDKLMHTASEDSDQIRAASRILDLAPEDVQPKLAATVSMQGPTTIVFEPAKAPESDGI